MNFAFVDNPIMINFGAVPQDSDPFRGVDLSVECGGSTFTGRYTAPLSVDIADIVATMVDAVPDVSDACGWFGPVAMVEDAAMLERRHAHVTADGVECDFYALPGGISKQNLRFYASRGTDIFADRFCNYAGNFFLTTKAKGWKVVVPETELSPLYFVCDRGMTVVMRELVSGQETSAVLPDKGIYALDIERMRRFFVSLNVLASVYDIYVATDSDRVYSCRIVISRVPAGRESHLVRYRTSLGVFDVIDLRGEISYGYENVDLDRYRAFDPDVNAFAYGRDRRATVSAVKISTGLKHISSAAHLLDMLSSDEVYLDGVRVLPDADEVILRGDVPNDFEITLRAADEVSLYTADIDMLGSSVRPRVHSDEFEETFN